MSKRILNGGDTPPAYPVGLLLDLTSKEDNKGSDILEWLDQQPPRSVVFLCFHGGFSEKQAREIALALFSLVYPSSMSARRVHKSGRSSPGRSLWFGVPTAVWPLYPEQKFNAFEMVEELGLAVEIRNYWRNYCSVEVVTAEEIERAITCLMKQNSYVRKRVKEMSDKCHAGWMVAHLKLL
uniref:Uncharacterized protein n=3 Tax=Brassica TaxID=3705 RepID=A0A0D3C2K2_BRAOL